MLFRDLDADLVGIYQSVFSASSSVISERALREAMRALRRLYHPDKNLASATPSECLRRERMLVFIQSKVDEYLCWQSRQFRCFVHSVPHCSTCFAFPCRLHGVAACHSCLGRFV